MRLDRRTRHIWYQAAEAFIIRYYGLDVLHSVALSEFGRCHLAVVPDDVEFDYDRFWTDA